MKFISAIGFFQTNDVPPLKGIENARVLLNLGDSVTTGHISPGGSISDSSHAARLLISKG